MGAGARIVGSLLQRSPQPDPATLLGKGKLTEVRSSAHAAAADLVIFDHDLTPSQLRNLERELDLRVIDRTQLILDIFAGRARSREGQLQVELAQLNYLLPRLGGRGTELSRLGGGIGTRGPGEQQLEYDRRRIRTRIRSLREAIEKVRSQRALHRARRRDRQFLTVALVGYTNAGKSTLFNALTSSTVLTSSRLFATLDPTVRALPLPSRRPVLISDTVGFIQKLPPHLVAAFRATLEELEDASLLLHVTDASDLRYESQDSAVEGLLETLSVGTTPRLHVWNKIDLVDATGRNRLPSGPRDVWVSASRGEGLDTLRQRIDEALTAGPRDRGRTRPLACRRREFGPASSLWRRAVHTLRRRASQGPGATARIALATAEKTRRASGFRLLKRAFSGPNSLWKKLWKTHSDSVLLQPARTRQECGSRADVAF